MAKVTGKDAAIYVKQYDLSGEGNRVSIAYAVDTVEATCFQAGAKDYVEGNYAWTAGIDGYWANTGQASSAVFGLIGSGTQIISIFPEGKSSGKVGYEGWGILTSYNPEALMTGAVVFSADMQGDNSLYRTTMLNSGIKTYNGTSTARNLGTSDVTRGVYGVLRVLGTATEGTVIVKVQQCATEGGSYADALGFGTVAFGDAPMVTLKAHGTAAGPWFKSVHTITGPSPSFNLTISCASEY